MIHLLFIKYYSTFSAALGEIYLSFLIFSNAFFVDIFLDMLLYILRVELF